MLTIRRAAPSDAVAIAALVRESFQPADLDLTIYGCAGIARDLLAAALHEERSPC